MPSAHRAFSPVHRCCVTLLAPISHLPSPIWFHLVDETLKEDRRQREDRWTESVAVGSRAFVEETKERLGFRANGRSVEESVDGCTLREEGEDYLFGAKKATLRPENTYYWGQSHEMSDT
jgi:hypothetical protein